jgi:deoxyribose-phosphate aldolase
MNLALDEILSLADQYELALPLAAQAFSAPVGMDLAGWLDQTLLKPEASSSEVRQLCVDARSLRFASVCVNPSYLPLAASLLNGSQTKACTVIAFPLGAMLPELKAHETHILIEKGAAEIDMVMNIGALKSQDLPLVFDDIQAVAQAAAGKAIVKVILETALLTRREKILGCLLAKAAGADFVKTSTGFGPGGATLDDVTLMRRVVGAQMGVKASGGIRTLENALAMIRAGANRVGTSAGVSILQTVLQGEVI